MSKLLLLYAKHCKIAHILIAMFDTIQNYLESADKKRQQLQKEYLDPAVDATADYLGFGDKKKLVTKEDPRPRTPYLVQRKINADGGVDRSVGAFKPSSRNITDADVDAVKAYTQHGGYNFIPAEQVVSTNYDESDTRKHPRMPVEANRAVAKASPLSSNDQWDKDAILVDMLASPGKEREAIEAARLLAADKGIARRQALYDLGTSLAGQLPTSPSGTFPNTHYTALPITLGALAVDKNPEKFRYNRVQHLLNNSTGTGGAKKLTDAQVNDIENAMPDTIWREQFARAANDPQEMANFLSSKPKFLAENTNTGKVNVDHGSQFAFIAPHKASAELKMKGSNDGTIKIPYVLNQALNNRFMRNLDTNGRWANDLPNSALNDYTAAPNDYGSRMHEGVHSQSTPVAAITPDGAKKLDAVLGTGDFDAPKRETELNWRNGSIPLSENMTQEGYAASRSPEAVRAMSVMKNSLLRSYLAAGMSPAEAVRKVQDPEHVKSVLRTVYDDVTDPNLKYNEMDTSSHHYPGNWARENDSVEVQRAVRGMHPFFQQLLYADQPRKLPDDVFNKIYSFSGNNDRLINTLTELNRTYGKLDKKDWPKHLNMRETPSFFGSAPDAWNSDYWSPEKYKNFNQQVSPEELNKAFEVLWPQVRNNNNPYERNNDLA